MNRPAAEEHAPYYSRYIDLVPDGDICSILAEQGEQTRRLVSSMPPEKGDYRYAPDKWSVKQVIGHMSDGERIFGYRAVCFARGEKQELPGFDENEYVRQASFDAASLADLIEEFSLLRRANIIFFRGLTDDAWQRRGVANNNPISVRALAFAMAGHERHHLHVLRERYGLGGDW